MPAALVWPDRVDWQVGVGRDVDRWYFVVPNCGRTHHEPFTASGDHLLDQAAPAVLDQRSDDSDELLADENGDLVVRVRLGR